MDSVQCPLYGVHIAPSCTYGHRKCGCDGRDRRIMRLRSGGVHSAALSARRAAAADPFAHTPAADEWRAVCAYWAAARRGGGRYGL